MRFSARFALAGVASLLASGVNAQDWTQRAWDVIVVGAGPAGMIGMFISSIKIIAKFSAIYIDISLCCSSAVVLQRRECDVMVG
jgi:hypothetical protein